MPDTMLLRVLAQYMDGGVTQSLSFTPPDSVLPGLTTRLRSKVAVSTYVGGVGYQATLDVAQFASIYFVCIKNLDNSQAVQVVTVCLDATVVQRTNYQWANAGCMVCASRVTPANGIVLTAPGGAVTVDCLVVGN